MLFASASSYAQVAFGGKIGINDANQKVSLNGTLGIGGSEAESKIGFNIGVFAEIGEGNIRFQPELNFNTKGSDRPGVDSIGASRIHTISYLEVPLQAKWYFFDDDKFSAYGMAGLSFGFAIGGNVQEDNQDEIELQFDDTDELGYDGRLDVSLPFTAGVTMILGEGKLFAEARYIWGASKVQNVEEDSVIITGFNAKNRTTQFNVGYMFNF